MGDVIKRGCSTLSDDRSPAIMKEGYSEIPDLKQILLPLLWKSLRSLSSKLGEKAMLVL